MQSKGEDDNPLDILRNVDPALFEWVRPEEIMAGGTTCGFLHAPLGTDLSVDYPLVKHIGDEVFFCDANINPMSVTRITFTFHFHH